MKDLIEEFRGWTGRGNLIQANNTAAKIFEKILEYIERSPEATEDPVLEKLKLEAALERNDQKTVENITKKRSSKKEVK